MIHSTLEPLDIHNNTEVYDTTREVYINKLTLGEMIVVDRNDPKCIEELVGFTGNEVGKSDIPKDGSKMYALRLNDRKIGIFWSTVEINDDKSLHGYLIYGTTDERYLMANLRSIFASKTNTTSPYPHTDIDVDNHNESHGLIYFLIEMLENKDDSSHALEFDTKYPYDQNLVNRILNKEEYTNEVMETFSTLARSAGRKGEQLIFVPMLNSQLDYGLINKIHPASTAQIILDLHVLYESLAVARVLH